MKIRTARLWAVLAGLAAVVLATVEGSRPAELGAGMLCVACAVLLVHLDGLRKRRRTRR